MKKTWKQKLAKTTANYRNLDKKALTMKSSWDEVSKLLDGAVAKKRKTK